MKHPNRLDWMIYNLFRWWWNPIFVSHSWLAKGLILEMDKWIREQEAENVELRKRLEKEGA